MSFFYAIKPNTNLTRHLRRSECAVRLELRKKSIVMTSSSASTSRWRRRVSLMRQPSREDEYEGRKRYCHHKLVAPRWTAWTDANTRRRFYGCRYYYQDEGCGSFGWHDCEFGEREIVVIKELLDDIDTLYDENKQLRRGNDSQRMCEEVDSIHCELRKIKRKRERMEIEAKKVELKFKITVAALIMTWIWLVYVYVGS